jgi:hypothetical protein
MGFLDRVADYNKGKEATVPVNPPEAEQVLATKTAPEVAGVPTPSPVGAATVAATAPSATPAGELTRGQKAAATRAANKAAAGQASPNIETTSATATDDAQRLAANGGSVAEQRMLIIDKTPERPAFLNMDDFTNEELVAELRKRGLGVTAVKQY